MGQHKEDDQKATENALSRLTGCDLSHLSLEEAKLIQTVRDLNMDPALLMEALSIKGLRDTMIQEATINRLQPGETITLNGQLFGREKDWKSE